MKFIACGWPFWVGLLFDFRWVTDIFDDVSWDNWWIVYLIVAVLMGFLAFFGFLLEGVSATIGERRGKNMLFKGGIPKVKHKYMRLAYAGATLHYLGALVWSRDAASLFLAMIHGTLWGMGECLASISHEGTKTRR